MGLRIYQDPDRPWSFILQRSDTPSDELGPAETYTVDDSAYALIGPFTFGTYEFEMLDSGAFLSQQGDAYLLKSGWLEDTAYTEDDIVKNLDDVTDPDAPVWRAYVCTTTGTSDTIDVWTDDTPYTEGDRVENGLNAYICTVSGTSQMGGSGPTGTDESGIVDGTCEWGFIGLAADLPTGPVGTGVDIADGTAVWAYLADTTPPATFDDETWEYAQGSADGFAVSSGQNETEGYFALKAFSGGTVRMKVRCRSSSTTPLPEP